MSKLIYLLSPIAVKDTIHLPMISFSILAVDIDFSEYDLLMFTSKQAVKSIEQINLDWKKVPCIAIGEATANEIISLGAEVVHQAQNFYAKELSQDIVTLFKEKKILYLRPKEVSFDSKAYLETEGIELDEKIIYETSCNAYDKTKKPSKDAIIIFTSPSTIRCFFKSFDWDESYTAVVIGEATKKHLPSYVCVEVAASPQIEACVSKAKELLLSSNSK